MLSVCDAIASIKGNERFPDIRGTVKFLGISEGTWVEAEIFGLPPFSAATKTSPQTGPFAFHVHADSSCGTASDTSNDIYRNPACDRHGNLAGDFPVLFSNNGTAKMLFFSNRFTPDEVIGKTVIIHESPDDYKKQPNGSGGKSIACGIITKSKISPDSVTECF